MTDSDNDPTGSRGRRRGDRVLAPDYLNSMGSRSLPEVRSLRDVAEQEETDLSYVRRMLQGRIDILRAERGRRAGEFGEDVVSALPRILAERPRPGPRGLGRHTAVEPSESAERRREVEGLLADVALDDLPGLSEEQLDQALSSLEAGERRVSQQRQEVQQVVDACSAEITRRYREGEAFVADLLH